METDRARSTRMGGGRHEQRRFAILPISPSGGPTRDAEGGSYLRDGRQAFAIQYLVPVWSFSNWLASMLGGHFPLGSFDRLSGRGIPRCRGASSGMEFPVLFRAPHCRPVGASCAFKCIARSRLTVMPGSRVSTIISSVSETDRRRRRCGPVGISGFG